MDISAECNKQPALDNRSSDIHKQSVSLQSSEVPEEATAAGITADLLKTDSDGIDQDAVQLTQHLQRDVCDDPHCDVPSNNPCHGVSEKACVPEIPNSMTSNVDKGAVTELLDSTMPVSCDNEVGVNPGNSETDNSQLFGMKEAGNMIELRGEKIIIGDKTARNKEDTIESVNPAETAATELDPTLPFLCENQSGGDSGNIKTGNSQLVHMKLTVNEEVIDTAKTESKDVDHTMGSDNPAKRIEPQNQTGNETPNLPQPVETPQPSILHADTNLSYRGLVEKGRVDSESGSDTSDDSSSESSLLSDDRLEGSRLASVGKPVFHQTSCFEYHINMKMCIRIDINMIKSHFHQCSSESDTSGLLQLSAVSVWSHAPMINVLLKHMEKKPVTIS